MLADNIILCGVDIWLKNYCGAAMSLITALWLGVNYILVNIVCAQNRMIDAYRGFTDELIAKLATKNTTNDETAGGNRCRDEKAKK